MTGAVNEMRRLGHLLIAAVLGAVGIGLLVGVSLMADRVSFVAAVPVGVVAALALTLLAVKSSDFYRRGRGDLIGPAASVTRDFLGLAGYGGPDFERSAPRAARRLTKLGKRATLSGSLHKDASGLKFVPSRTWRRLGAQTFAIDLTAWEFVPEASRRERAARWVFDSSAVDLATNSGMSLRLAVRDVRWTRAILSESIG
jgi:hypothetical protein